MNSFMNAPTISSKRFWNVSFNVVSLILHCEPTPVDQQQKSANHSMEFLNKWDKVSEAFLQRIVTGG